MPGVEAPVAVTQPQACSQWARTRSREHKRPERGTIPHVAPDTAAPGTDAPPGPKISRWASWTYRFSADPLNFLTTLARTYGDLVSYRTGGELIFFANHPQYSRDLLVTHNRNFTKSRGLERSKRLLGNGLLTSEGALHLRQRRLMQPAFHRDRIASYGRTMVAYADR